jgi:hypothetical protein
MLTLIKSFIAIWIIHFYEFFKKDSEKHWNAMMAAKDYHNSLLIEGRKNLVVLEAKALAYYFDYLRGKNVRF